MTLALLVGAALLVAANPPDGRDALLRARQLYNSAQYDMAIAAAEEARGRAGSADAASLISARARLERFRRSADPSDLMTARDRLKQVRPEGLDPRDRVELIVGLGESLFLDDRFGASAEFFASALGRAESLPPQVREGVLEWWASAVDRDAQSRPSSDRAPRYHAIVERMQTELQRDPYSAPAAYWVAAGARALGDLEWAWDAAVAGWVRSAYTGGRRETLRADLDRLVQQAIIPERVRQLPAANRDADEAAAGLRREWDEIKQRWD